MVVGRYNIYYIFQMKKGFTPKGFTIIELVVVIAIIAILAAMVLINVTSYLAKARNASTISNINNYSKALATYYAENSSYPTGSFCSLGTPQLTAAYSSCSFNSSLATYIPKLPSGYYINNSDGIIQGYSYTGGANTYSIYYRLEGVGVSCGIGVFSTNGTNTTLCILTRLKKKIFS